MTPNLTLRTRREFLRRTTLAGAFSWTVPSFLANTFTALQAEALEKTDPATGKDSTILVVLQMAGGNDGLNTVVPYANDFYHRARTRLAVAPGDVLRLTDQIGLHPSLAGFKQLYDRGELSIVQGAGYPNPNRSHFRSTEIWQTASDSGRFETYGWLGRYFDNTCSGCDATIAVNIGHQMPQAFAAKIPKGVSVENPQSYRFISSDHKGPGSTDDRMEQSFRQINDSVDETTDNSGGTISAIAGASTRTGQSALDFLERTALDAQVSSDQIRAISSRIQNQATYPGSQLGNSLKLIARLIGGGLPTRIFYVSQGGYDTHVNQVGTHARLLKELGDSVQAFCDDLRAQGNLDRVLVMTFSEFGRRVSENASGGTDHGAAAPMFLMGNRLRAGLLGQYPSLAPTDLFEGDLKFTVDFRSVYAAVLENWLKTPSIPILGRQFPIVQAL